MSTVEKLIYEKSFEQVSCRPSGQVRNSDSEPFIYFVFNVNHTLVISISISIYLLVYFYFFYKSLQIAPEQTDKT